MVIIYHRGWREMDVYIKKLVKEEVERALTVNSSQGISPFPTGSPVAQSWVNAATNANSSSDNSTTRTSTPVAMPLVSTVEQARSKF